eukprot:gene22730-29369_t
MWEPSLRPATQSPFSQQQEWGVGAAVGMCLERELGDDTAATKGVADGGGRADGGLNSGRAGGGGGAKGVR